MRIEQVDDLIPVVHQRVSTVAGEALDRAERAMDRSILLSALFLLTVLVGSNAVFATRSARRSSPNTASSAMGCASGLSPPTSRLRQRRHRGPVHTGVGQDPVGRDWYDVYEVGTRWQWSSAMSQGMAPMQQRRWHS